MRALKPLSAPTHTRGLGRDLFRFAFLPPLDDRSATTIIAFATAGRLASKMTTFTDPDSASAQSAPRTANLDGADPRRSDAVPDAPQAIPIPLAHPAREDEHAMTAERLELLSWGEGSVPSLPSIDNDSNTGVRGFYRQDANGQGE